MSTAKKTSALILPALGVVYGDIGTSPLYAMKETFSGHSPVPVTADNILGILSLIFWTIMVIVTLKYIVVVLMADNKGEGGIMALSSIAARKMAPRYKPLIAIVGLIGAALFLGDAIITPAMSVLSAMEGITVYAPSFQEYVLPIALTVLSALFLIQRHGTSRIGSFFGPIILIWFAAMALLGAVVIFQNPTVLSALSPRYAFAFVRENPLLSYLALGSIVLCVTGAEALYADMGHFGRGPVRIAWSAIVLPALLLNYFGQGAILLNNAEAVKNPFFYLAPSWAVIPLVIIATLATVIASQSVISGAYSLIRQAIQLGYFPRKRIVFTSEEEAGQIYLPSVNYFLFVSVLFVVILYESSSNLAAAYGIAVTGTMVITTGLLMIVARTTWRMPLFLVLLLGAPFLIIDLLFFTSNALKIFSGGLLPIFIGTFVFIVMYAWRRGRLLTASNRETGMTLTAFIRNVEDFPVTTVEGNAAFLSSSTTYVPFALLHNLKHNKVLHEKIFFVTVKTEDEPYVLPFEKVTVKHLNPRFTQITARYGYKETADMTEILALAQAQGVEISMEDTSFFLSKESVINTDRNVLSSLLNGIYIALQKNALRITEFFHIPSNRVVELGAQVELSGRKDRG